MNGTAKANDELLSNEACLCRSLYFGHDFSVDVKHPCMFFLQDTDRLMESNNF